MYQSYKFCESSDNILICDPPFMSSSSLLCELSFGVHICHNVPFNKILPDTSVGGPQRPPLTKVDRHPSCSSLNHIRGLGPFE